MNREQERLRRLRDRQLTDRDPLAKQRQFQRTTSQKERRARSKHYTLGEAWRTIPHLYRSPFIGLVFGVAVIVILPILWDSSWAFWAGLGATVFFILLGLLTGRALDLREELRDVTRH